MLDGVPRAPQQHVTTRAHARSRLLLLNTVFLARVELSQTVALTLRVTSPPQNKHRAPALSKMSTTAADSKPLDEKSGEAVNTETAAKEVVKQPVVEPAAEPAKEGADAPKESGKGDAPVEETKGDAPVEAPKGDDAPKEVKEVVKEVVKEATEGDAAKPAGDAPVEAPKEGGEAAKPTEEKGAAEKAAPVEESSDSKKAPAEAAPADEPAAKKQKSPEPEKVEEPAKAAEPEAKA